MDSRDSITLQAMKNEKCSCWKIYTGCCNFSFFVPFFLSVFLSFFLSFLLKRPDDGWRQCLSTPACQLRFGRGKIIGSGVKRQKRQRRSDTKKPFCEQAELPHISTYAGNHITTTFPPGLHSVCVHVWYRNGGIEWGQGTFNATQYLKSSLKINESNEHQTQCRG